MTLAMALERQVKSVLRHEELARLSYQKLYPLTK
jgi:hypothetical protein